jgi:hypothetical protein
MNQIKLSLRAADQPRVVKEEDGVPTFATVFAIHNPFRKGKSPESNIPITIKAGKELAATLVECLSKGTGFTVNGTLAYFKNPESGRESFSIWADQIADIVPPKATTGS